MTAIEILSEICSLTKDLKGHFITGKDDCGLYLDIEIPGADLSIRYYVEDAELPGLLASSRPDLDKAIRQNITGLIGWLEEWSDQKVRLYIPCQVGFKWTKKGRLHMAWQTEKGTPLNYYCWSNLKRSDFPLLSHAIAQQESGN
jgi:hypothetical protein